MGRLELAEDVSPGLESGEAPPFVVPMETVTDGGPLFDTAMRSLERLEHPDCADLWGGKDSSSAEEVQLTCDCTERVLVGSSGQGRVA